MGTRATVIVMLVSAIRSLPLFLLALVSCTHGNRPGQVDFAPYEIFSENAPFKIDPAKPPNGMHLVQILLQRQHMLVAGTGCGSPFDSKRTLGHDLSMLILPRFPGHPAKRINS